MKQVISEAAEIRSAIDQDYDAECVESTPRQVQKATLMAPASTIRDLQTRVTELLAERDDMRAKVAEMEAALKGYRAREERITRIVRDATLKKTTDSGRKHWFNRLRMVLLDDRRAA